ncbi:MAG TPA: dimethylmenaquinone methyltransferase [Rhodospirillaceae bacterium]|nr:dimethylmenaquinone methyltransferase [Rhodospirillaceae bacterium]HAT35337.1 dimethylmenaquinone methyltransferase [Rhodospirillaceae bacterium]|tara:strand:- start:54 stop:737 length:684 start_codon:yes stop_codon:yes gene_type:complete
MTAETENLVAAFKELSTPNVSDALDRLGIDGAPHGIGPLWEACEKIVGPAATMKLVPVGEGMKEPSAAMGSLEAVKVANKGDILVIDHGGRVDVNSYGGIVGFTTQHFGLAGCVIDGVTRDIDEYKELGLSVYGRGIIQQSIRNRCDFAGHSIDVELAGVKVRPGDFIMGDDNGILVIPVEHLEEVLEIAQTCKATEEQIIEEIRNGAEPVAAHEKVSYDQMTQAKK